MRETLESWPPESHLPRHISDASPNLAIKKSPNMKGPIWLAAGTVSEQLMMCVQCKKRISELIREKAELAVVWRASPPPSPRVPPKGSVLKMTSQPRWQRSVILKGMRRLDRLAGGTAHKTPRHYWNCFVLSSLFLWAAFSRASRTLLRPLSYLIDFLYIRVIVRGDASFWDAKLLRPSILYRWRVKLRDTSSFHCQTDPVAKPHAAYFSANDNREVA